MLDKFYILFHALYFEIKIYKQGQILKNRIFAISFTSPEYLPNLKILVCYILGNSEPTKIQIGFYLVI